jgi:hypothetical protein
VDGKCSAEMQIRNSKCTGYFGASSHCSVTYEKEMDVGIIFIFIYLLYLYERGVVIDFLKVIGILCIE